MWDSIGHRTVGRAACVGQHIGWAGLHVWDSIGHRTVGGAACVGQQSS